MYESRDCKDSHFEVDVLYTWILCIPFNTSWRASIPSITCRPKKKMLYRKGTSHSAGTKISAPQSITEKSVGIFFFFFFFFLKKLHVRVVEFSNIFFKVSIWENFHRSSDKCRLKFTYRTIQSACIVLVLLSHVNTNFSKFFARSYSLISLKNKPLNNNNNDPVFSHFTVGRERCNINIFFFLAYTMACYYACTVKGTSISKRAPSWPSAGTSVFRPSSSDSLRKSPWHKFIIWMIQEMNYNYTACRWFPTSNNISIHSIIVLTKSTNGFTKVTLLHCSIVAEYWLLLRYVLLNLNSLPWSYIDWVICNKPLKPQR